MYLSAALFFSPWLGIISCLLLAPGAYLDLLSRQSAGKLIPVWAISWFVVPPPFEWDADLLQWLRLRTSHATGLALDAMGVIYLRSGNTFEVPDQRFFVDDACGGIHSLLSIVGVSLVWGVYVRLPVPAFIFSVMCAAGAAISLNILRVLTVVLVYTRWGLDLSTGWFHELLGLGLFVVLVLFLWSVQHFWLFLLAPLNVNLREFTEDEDGPDDVATSHALAPAEEHILTATEAQDPVKSGRQIWWAKVAATIALLLWIPQFTHGIRNLATAPSLRTPFDPNEAAVMVDQQALPPELQGWKQIDYRSVLRGRHDQDGEVSRQWTYQAPWGLVEVSFDFPFAGFHQLQICYQGSGWTPSIQNSVSTASAPAGSFERVALKRHEFEVGTLIYSLWDDRGTLIAPRESSNRNVPLMVRLRNRLAPAGATSATAPPTTYQFQVLVTGEFALSQAEQDELLLFFIEARDRLRLQFTADSPVQADQPDSSSTDS